MGLFMKIGPRPGQSSTNTDVKSTDLPKLPGPTAQEVEFYSSTLSEDASLEPSRSMGGSVGFEHEYTAAVPSRLRESQVYLEPPEVDQQSWDVVESMPTDHDAGGQRLDLLLSERYRHTSDGRASPSYIDESGFLCDALELGRKRVALEMSPSENCKAIQPILDSMFSMESDPLEKSQNGDLQETSNQLHEQSFATSSTNNSRRDGMMPAPAFDLLKTVSAARATKTFERSIAQLNRMFYKDVLAVVMFQDSLLLQDSLITFYDSVAYPNNKAWNTSDNSIGSPLSIGTKSLGLETVEKLVNGGRPESLAEVYCFLAVCYAMSQCDIAPQRSLDRPQVVAGIRMLRRCIYIPQNPEATNKQRRLFDIMTDVFFEEFECALNWLKHNGPEGIFERLGQSAGLGGAMEDILNRRSKDRVPPDLSHSGSTFRACAKQKPPEAIDDDDLGPPSWLELSVLPVIQVLTDIATTLQDIGLGFFCFIALLCPALVIQTSSGWGGAAKHDPTTSSIIPQVEVIETPSGVAPFPSPSPSVYMPVSTSWDDAPAEMDEMEYLPFVEPIADVQALYQTGTENFASDPLSLISPSNVEAGTIFSDSMSTDETSGSTTPGNKQTSSAASPSTSSSQSRPRATRPNNGHIVCIHPGCTKRFKHKNNLYRHKKTHHASNDHSGASCSSSSAVSKPPQDQKWQCLFCKAKRGTARGRENIEQHMKDEHAQELERYKRGLLGQSLMFYAGMSQG